MLFVLLLLHTITCWGLFARHSHAEPFTGGPLVLGNYSRASSMTFCGLALFWLLARVYDIVPARMVRLSPIVVVVVVVVNAIATSILFSERGYGQYWRSNTPRGYRLYRRSNPGTGLCMYSMVSAWLPWFFGFIGLAFWAGMKRARREGVIAV